MLSTTLRRAAIRRPTSILPSQQSTRVYLQQQHQRPVICTFSTDSKKKDNDSASGDSLRDAVHRLKQDNDNDDDYYRRCFI